jgi:hypothetical protein
MALLVGKLEESRCLQVYSVREYQSGTIAIVLVTQQPFDTIQLIDDV